MRKIIFTSMMLAAGYAAQAQVGINTQNPQGALHVDGSSDNNASGAPTEAQQANDFAVTATGNVGIGTTSPASKLEVKGAATNSEAYDAGAGTTIDYSLSNLAYTTASAGAFTLNNIKNGGTYTLNVRGTASGTATFTAAGFTVKYANNQATTAGKETMYTFITMGTVIYVYIVAGL